MYYITDKDKYIFILDYYIIVRQTILIVIYTFYNRFPLKLTLCRTCRILTL